MLGADWLDAGVEWQVFSPRHANEYSKNVSNDFCCMGDWNTVMMAK